MKATFILNEDNGNVNIEIESFDRNFTEELSPGEAIKISELIFIAAVKISQEVFRQWLLQFECHEKRIEKDSKIYRYKKDSEKRVITRFGEMKINRRIYQQDQGGKIYVPLDAWGVEDQQVSPDVREAVLFMAAVMTPGEIESCLKKIAMFHPSRTCIQNVINKMEETVSQNEDRYMEEIRNNEELPMEEAKAIVVSADGANILTRESGIKKGRPTTRPKDEKSESRETPSSYKNVMVGMVNLYGDVSRDQKTPERLSQTVMAQMPERNAPQFWKKFDEEVSYIEKSCSSRIPKLLINDGGRNLWAHFDSKEQYNHFERLVDFHHALEHISVAGEGIFGKGTEEGKIWYKKQESTLLEHEDGAERVLRSLKYYLKVERYNNTRKGQIEQCITFISNNRSRMEYKRFRDNGWPIGSGPVEGACKNIVKLRLCRNGMRWSNKGGQIILFLRSLVKSNRWDLFWNSYMNSLNNQVCPV
ncbi:MAG: hypothetical protein Q4G69_08825 [Planctomycetia bacterium]|nr:hypothetical protein [Planctomycetia bacterium]